MFNFDPITLLRSSISNKPSGGIHECEAKGNIDLNSTATNKDEFPYKLGPFGICSSDLLDTHFTYIFCDENQTGCYQIDPRQFKYAKNIHFQILIEFIEHISKSKQMNVHSYGILGNISPLYMLTLSAQSKKYANIPVDAVYYAWCYPAVLPNDILISNPLKRKWLSDSNTILLTVGGYMLFDRAKQLVQINTLTPDLKGALQFTEPHKWDNRFTHSLHKNGRFQEINTVNVTQYKGAKYFCWLFPMEELQTDTFEKCIFTKCGAFVYLFHEPGDLTDSTLVEMDRYFEVVSTTAHTKQEELESLECIVPKRLKAVDDWDEDKVSNWLNEIHMNELRIPFFKDGINGERLNDLKEAQLEDIVQHLSKSELESIVMKQFNVHLMNLKQNEMRRNTNEDILQKEKIKELQSQIESIHNLKICLICYENSRNILIKPCNHMCCCEVCIQNVKCCPVCHQKIQSKEKIYN